MRAGLAPALLMAALCTWPACSNNGGPAVCDDGARVSPAFPDADQTFWVGPHLEHTTTSSVAISWETAQAADTRLEYGRKANYGQTLTGDPGTMHQLVVEGLKPGTDYHYRACSGERCTADLIFSTDPGPLAPITFAVYADCQDNPEMHNLVTQQIMADGANLAIVAGDTVSDGSVREQYKERFYDPARQLAQRIPRYAAVGNHDRKDTEVEAFRDYHMFPSDPGVPQAETSYSFTFGDAFFLVLDNTLDHYDFFFPLADGVASPLWDWLQERVASEEAQSATWRFAFAHYPPDTDCREDGVEYGMPESAVREYLLPLLWQHGFQGYFAGHVHCYERFDFDGHLVITTGGGGGGVEPEDRCGNGLPEARIHRCVHHATLLELGCEAARVWARDIEGNIIEELSLLPDGSHALIE